MITQYLRILNTLTAMQKLTVMRTMTGIVIIFLIALLSGCIATEPMATAPHINLSPQTVLLATDSNREQVLDFGLEVSTNESDSLENLEILPGVRVRRVSPNSPAQAAEIKAGDIILAINNVGTNHPDTLTAILQNAETGQGLQVSARRDTTVYETTLVGQSRKRAEVNERYRADPLMTRAGYRTEIVEADGKQLTVARIVETFPKSPFKKSKIMVGDAIIAVNHQPVESAQGLVNQLMSFDQGEKISISVLNQQSQLTEESIRLWNPGRRISRLSLWPLFSYQSGLSPSTTKFSILDLWFVSLFKYERENTEKNYRLFTLFSFGSGAGELLDDATTAP